MHRRAFLATLSAGLAGVAGCQGQDDRGRRDPYGVPSRTATATPTEPPGVTPVADVGPPTGTGRAVRTLDGERRVAVPGAPLTDTARGRLLAGFSAPPTGRSPAELWVGVRNDDERPREFRFGPTPPLSGYRGRIESGDRRELLLVPLDARRFPAETAIPEAPTDRRWVADGPLEAPEPTEPLEVKLEPGEGLVGRYALVRSPAAARLPERALFEFSTWSGPVTLSLAVWDTALERRGDSRFDPERRPPGLPGFERTTWYHADDKPAYLEPQRERLSLPTATTLEVHNYAYRALPPETVGWAIYKRHADTWKRIGPWSFPGVLERLAPGATQRLRLAVSSGADVADARGDGSADLVEGVPHLGGGTYAVRFRGFVGTDFRPETPVSVGASERKEWTSAPTTFGALLELVGDPVTVTPGAVASVERDGATVTVQSREDTRRPATLALERTDADPPELIPEQVLQFPALRNAVAHVEAGVRTVRVRTRREAATAPVGALGQGERLAFSFGGSAFLARVREPSDVEG